MTTKKKGSSKNLKSNFEGAYAKALRCLARRDHSEREIRQKLGAYPKEAIDHVLERLTHYGFLRNPTDLSKAWAESVARRGRGKLRVAQELKKRGLPPVEVDSESQKALCRDVFARKYGQNGKMDPKMRAKAFRYLTYRGFDVETVNSVLREA